MEGIITLISVAVNALAAVLAPFIARKLAAQKEKLQRADDTMATLGAGVRVIEKAIEENKDALSRTGAGNKIVKTIGTYGPAARQLVDSARGVAHTLREAGTSAYVEAVIQRERREHAERERQRGNNV